MIAAPKKKRKSKSDEKGTALLEFSIVFPFCFLLFLGIVDLCGWLKSQLLLTRVAYEGARYASVVPSIDNVNDPRVTRRVQRVIDEMNAQKRQILNPSFTVTKNNQDNAIEVVVNSQHEFLFLPKTFFGNNSQVSARVHAAYLYEA